MDFGGSFSFHKEFPEAPNPWLSLARLGTIGLPLSTREAAVIKSEAKQAPFGKGERTIVDRNIRDTWEMDASEVRMASLNRLRSHRYSHRSLLRTPNGNLLSMMSLKRSVALSV